MNFLEAMEALQQGHMIYGPFHRYYNTGTGGFFLKTYSQTLNTEYYLMIDLDDWGDEDPSRSFTKIDNIFIKYGSIMKDNYKIVTKEEADQIYKDWKAKEDAKEIK